MLWNNVISRLKFITRQFFFKYDGCQKTYTYYLQRPHGIKRSDEWQQLVLIVLKGSVMVNLWIERANKLGNLKDFFMHVLNKFCLTIYISLNRNFKLFLGRESPTQLRRNTVKTGEQTVNSPSISQITIFYLMVEYVHVAIKTTFLIVLHSWPNFQVLVFR